MTLTTEQLRERAAAIRCEALNKADQGFVFQSQRLYETAAALDELAANREAQPVLYASEETLAYAKEGEKSLVTWSEPMGDAVIPLYTAPPAPAAPPEIPLTSPVAAEYVAGWNACRAAMLAQPVSGGYKLITVDFLTTASRLIDICRTHAILNDGDYKQRTINECENTMKVIDDLLAAAPEGGNG
ncbi:TPA: hypothetical protein NK775_001747 [Serratia marcescens]|nr:hypothetical protein [Serratia marcescens]